MTPEELTERLKGERILALMTDEWEAVASEFEPVWRHDTGFAGELLVARGDVGLLAVEAPKPAVRVVRQLADEEEAKSFVEYRLAQYERMWDGCGCKIDYYMPLPEARDTARPGWPSPSRLG